MKYLDDRKEKKSQDNIDNAKRGSSSEESDSETEPIKKESSKTLGSKNHSSDVDDEVDDNFCDDNFFIANSKFDNRRKNKTEEETAKSKYGCPDDYDFISYKKNSRSQRQSADAKSKSKYDDRDEHSPTRSPPEPKNYKNRGNDDWYGPLSKQPSTYDDYEYDPIQSSTKSRTSNNDRYDPPFYQPPTVDDHKYDPIQPSTKPKKYNRQNSDRYEPSFNQPPRTDRILQNSNKCNQHLPMEPRKQLPSIYRDDNEGNIAIYQSLLFDDKEWNRRRRSDFEDRSLSKKERFEDKVIVIQDSKYEQEMNRKRQSDYEDRASHKKEKLEGQVRAICDPKKMNRNRSSDHENWSAVKEETSDDNITYILNSDDQNKRNRKGPNDEVQVIVKKAKYDDRDDLKMPRKLTSDHEVQATIKTENEPIILIDSDEENEKSMKVSRTSNEKPLVNAASSSNVDMKQPAPGDKQLLESPKKNKEENKKIDEQTLALVSIANTLQTTNVLLFALLQQNNSPQQEVIVPVGEQVDQQVVMQVAEQVVVQVVDQTIEKSKTESNEELKTESKLESEPVKTVSNANV